MTARKSAPYSAGNRPISLNRTVIADGAKTALKAKGWKKRGFTWIKKCDDEIMIVIDLQGSLYDNDTFYINTGVYIIPLGSREIPKISDCHMRQRINTPVGSADFFVRIADKWEEWYGGSERVRKKYSENNIPEFTDKRVFSYFGGVIF